MAERRVTFLIGANIANFRKGLKTAEQRLNRFGRNAERLGRGMQNFLTLPILAAGGAALKMAGDFQTSFTRIETLVGISRSEVDRMKESVLALSQETGKGASELAAALFTITSAGLRGAEAMAVLERAAKASAIGLGETQEIARAVTSVVQAYGAENINAAKATDILTAIVREGNLEAESLAPTLGRVIGLASQLGISFEEVGASIATYTRLGVSAEEATTGLRGIMSTLIKPTNETREALAGIGLTAQQLRERIQNDGLAVSLNSLMKEFEGNDEALGKLIPNVRALSAVLGTAGSQGEEYVQISRNITESAGIVNDGFRRTAEDGMFKFNQQVQALKNEFIRTGNILLPVAIKIMDAVGNLTAKFNSMDAQTRRNNLTLLALTAAAGPAVVVIGKLAKAFALAASPIFAKIAALGALVAALDYVRRNSKSFRLFFSDLWADLKNFVVDSVYGMTGALETLMSVLPNSDIAFAALRANLLGLKEEVPDRDDGYGFQSFTEFLGSLSDDAVSNLEKLANMLFQVRQQANDTRRAVEGAAGSQGTESGSTGSGVPINKKDVQETATVMGALNGEMARFIDFAKKLGTVNTDEPLNKISEGMLTVMEVGRQVTGELTFGLQNMVFQGEKFIKVISNIGKLLASTAIQKVVSFLLLGGGSGSGFFGSGKGGLFGGIGRALGFANGGRPPLNRVSIVGERGPELFMPDSAGTIIPNHDLGGMVAGGGGGAITTSALVSALSKVRWKMDVDKGQIYAAGLQGGLRVNR